MATKCIICIREHKKLRKEIPNIKRIFVLKVQYYYVYIKDKIRRKNLSIFKMTYKPPCYQGKVQSEVHLGNLRTSNNSYMLDQAQICHPVQEDSCNMSIQNQ